MQQATITTKRQGPIRIVMLNRPERRNAINPTLRLELISALREANADQKTSAVVLTGTGGHFCSGGDLSSMDQRDVASVHERMATVAELVMLIRQSAKPYSRPDISGHRAATRE